MVIVRIHVPDGVMSLVKYVMAATRMMQDDVIVTMIQMGQAAVPFDELPDTVKTIHKQTRAKVEMDKKISKEEGA